MVGLPNRLILVFEHYIMCLYVCLHKCTNEIDVLSTNSIPTWVQYILWLRLWIYVPYAIEKALRVCKIIVSYTMKDSTQAICCDKCGE